MLKGFIKTGMKVIDMGCGTGEYIRKLHMQGVRFHGVDISQGMIAEARRQCMGIDKVSFEVSGTGTRESNFDCGYLIHVLAHVNDEIAKMLLSNMREAVKDNGRIILCEQIAPSRYSGNGFTRRTYFEYIDMVERAGFEVEKKYCARIQFWFHQIVFEWIIARIFRIVFANKSENVRLYCNRNYIYRLLSKICTDLSFYRVHKNLNGFGYLFLCAKCR